MVEAMYDDEDVDAPDAFDEVESVIDDNPLNRSRPMNREPDCPAD